ncbi:LysM peptidoglycan-binding domain-containing protein [Bradyrhizobium sp. HKCCYLRH3099]|uniref:LysM peptidoglycan-binding domain-containing protein n=1 Tax=unclassified Bradyrhizobium TaxID=2631580 RepID=UPI003EC052D1
MILNGKPMVGVILGVAALAASAAAFVFVLGPISNRDPAIRAQDTTGTREPANAVAGAPRDAGPNQTTAQVLRGQEQGASEQAASPLARVQKQASGLADVLGSLAPQAAVQTDLPAFDVVNVDPSGDAVVAGRAAPGTTVELLRNGEVHDRAVADRAGQFAMVPSRLPAGSYALTLRSKLADGREVISKQSVAVNVEVSRQPATVALLAPDEPTRVLSKPSAAIPQALAVDAVDHESDGVLRINGRARPGATVRLYLNDRLISSTVAGADGRLGITVGKGVSRAGDDRVRLDEVDAASGSVQARAEVPLSLPDDTLTTASVASAAAPTTADTARPAAQPTLLAAAGDPGEAIAPAAKTESRISTVTVARGDSLWHISRRVLGGGMRYAVIYKANREQIRSPDLIYPGQVFTIPAKP